MSLEDMEEELESLRDQLEYANRELETIAEEKDKVISALEFKVTSTKAQVEAEFRSRLVSVYPIILTMNTYIRIYLMLCRYDNSIN